MDEHDNGRFEYDMTHAPLCVKPPAAQIPAFQKAMTSAVIDYLRDSHHHGIKHHNSILPNGLSAGEAGMIYFRQRGCFPKRGTPAEANHQMSHEELMEYTLLSVTHHFHIVVQRDLFFKFVNASTFSHVEIEKHLIRDLRRFFQKTKIRKKGTNALLRAVVKDVKNHF